MARSRVLAKLNAGDWVVNLLGGITVPGSGTLDITNFFTDEELAQALQNGLAAEIQAGGTNKVLRIDDGAGTYDIDTAAKAAPFYNIVQPLVNDQTSAAHNHADAAGGGNFAGIGALTDLSTPGADSPNTIAKLDANGDLDLGTRKVVTDATSFTGAEVPNAAWVQQIAQGKAYQGNVITSRIVGTAAADPGIVGAGKAYVVTTAWGAFSVGDIVERNSADNGWTLLKAGAAGDRLILEDIGGGFSTGEQYSIIELVNPATPTFTKIMSAADGMYAIVAAGQYSDQMAIYDTAGKWQLHNWATHYTGGNGVNISGTTIEADADETTITATGGTGDQLAVKQYGIGTNEIGDISGDGLSGGGDGNPLSVTPYSGADTSMCPVNVSSDGVGVDTDDTTIKQTAGVLAVDWVPTKGQKIQFVFGRSGNVPDDSYMKSQDGIFANLSTYRVIRPCKVTGISVQVGTAPGTSTDFEVHKSTGGGAFSIVHASAKATVTNPALGATVDSGIDAGATFAKDDLIAVYQNNLVGTVPKDAVIVIELELTA